MKKFITAAFFTILPLILLTVTAASSDISLFQPADAERLLVTADNLNVRTGPGTGFLAIQSLNRGDEIHAIGVLGDFYVVHLSDDSVGVVPKAYVKADSYDTSEVFSPNKAQNTGLKKDTETLLSLINGARTDNGLPVYSLDNGLCRLAEMKALDMIENNYFSHQSPRYGSPFEMLKSFGIVYKSAGENIAGNKTAEGAYRELMNSPYHRINILNSAFNRVGIGVSEHPEYGKIIVQIFTEQ